MKTFIKVFLTLQLLWLTSCASYNPGNYALVMDGEHPVNTPINAEITTQLSTDPFTYVNFTFGNKHKNKWTRIRSIRITDISGIEGARLIIGPDLLSWSEGVKRKISIDNHNSQMFWGTMAGLMAAGAAVSAKNGNIGATKGLLGGALLTASILDINNMIDTADSLEISKLVPPTHLYNAFSIPPNLYLSRWAVFELPKNSKLEYLKFEITYLSGKKASYKVNLSGGSNRKK